MKFSRTLHEMFFLLPRHHSCQREALVPPFPSGCFLFIFIFVWHPCSCFRFRRGLVWGQVGALSSLSHFNAVSKQSSWFDSLLLSCWADQCHGGVQVPWGGECLIYKVVWADGLCQLLSHVRARIQGSSAEYCTVARPQRWYLFQLSAVPILPWWGNVEGALALQLVHKNPPR